MKRFTASRKGAASKKNGMLSPDSSKKKTRFRGMSFASSDGAAEQGHQANGESGRSGRSKDQIEQLYSEILDEALTSPDIKQRLIDTVSIDQKEKYVSIHKSSKKTRRKSDMWDDKDDSFVETLKKQKFPDIEILLDLRIRLSTAKKEYIQKFLAKNGVYILIDVISNRLNRRLIDEFDAAIIYEVLLSFKIIMNSAIGMKYVIEHPLTIQTFIKCLHFDFKPLGM
jgi:hypothetical protein